MTHTRGSTVLPAHFSRLIITTYGYSTRRTQEVTGELGRTETPAREYSTFPFVSYLELQVFS